ncbi:MAG: hypothetical protein ACODAD_12615, partial [Planctomycetota bacterium]
MAVLNVVPAASLLVGFKSIPQQSGVGDAVQQTIDQATEFDASIRLEFTQRIRDVWEDRARQYRYWAVSAGAVILINTAVFFLHLLDVEAGEMPANRRRQLTGDA